MIYGPKNSINKYNSKKITSISLASLLAISGCGGDKGGGSNNTSSVESQNISFSLQASNPIAGIVEIRSTQGDILLTGISSDNNGNINIKKSDFEDMLNQYSLSRNDFIEVYTIDQATVNAYSQSYSPMNMSVSALLQSSDLNKAVIGPVSKFVHNLILQHTDYSPEVSSAAIQNIIDETLKKVALSDINHDGVINNSDVIGYNMSIFESGLETVLKDSGYIDALINGNEDDISEKQNVIMQLQEDLNISSNESSFQGSINGENGAGEAYVPVELQGIKTELESKLSASMEELHKLDEQLSTTQSQQTQLSDNIKNQKLSISQHSSELNNIKDFEKKIENIDFQNDSDSTLKTKIESLPNVENISRNISPMKARTVSIQSDTVFLSGAKSSSSETLPQLEERKEKLKLEILDVLKKIQDINQSISQKQTDINTKNTEIQNKESVLIEKQAIVDEYQQKIKDFQDRNSTEINNYKNARREYISNANILKREGMAQNLWLDIGSMTEEVGDADFTWSAVQRRANSISKPNKYSYSIDTNSKNYSDLFPFEETIVDYLGTTLIAKMHYGSSSDYPATMEIYKNGSYIGKNRGIRSEKHKNDLKKYYGTHLEKSLLENILTEMISQENLVDSYANIIYDLAKIELDWENKKDEYKALKDSIQPTIDALKNLKRDLERAKNILENEKKEKQNLEQLKQDLIAKLTILQGQINNLSTTKLTIENILSNLEEDLKNIEKEYETNEQNMVEINNNKNSIEISITTTQSELEELNNQINETSDKLQKYVFKEIIWGKVFEFEVVSSVEGGETQEIMQQKGREKFEEIKKNIISNEFYFSNGSSYIVYSYSPEGKGNFPAYVWGTYNLYGKSRTTESYVANSQNDIDTIGNTLKNTIEKNIIQNAIHTTEHEINTSLHDGLYSRGRVHYYHNNANEKFPATVSLELRLGNYSFYKHGTKFLYSQEDVDNEIAEMNANIIPYKSATKVNAGKPIWIVDKLTPMVGGAYYIYEFDGKYIATWKVANKGTWRFGGIWKNPYELEAEVIRILDDRQHRNSTEPTSIDEDRSPVEMEEEKIEEINEFQTPQIMFDNLYQDYLQICIEHNSNQAPLVGPGSIHLNDEEKITYNVSCNSDPRRLEIEQKMENILKSSTQFGLQYAIYNVNNHAALSEQRQAGFTKGVTDGVIGIISQPKELAQAGWAGIVETKEGLEKFAHFFIGLPLIYGYDALVDNETSNKILQNAKQDISIRGRETRLEIESVIDDFKELKDDINFLLENLHTIHPEQAAYYRGYLEGLFSTLIGEAIALTYITKNGKAVSKKILTSDNGKKITSSINKMMQHINITKEVYRITRNEVDLKVVKILENGRSVYGESFNDSLKSSLILGDRYGIRVRTLYHLINGEWSEGGFFKGGLHSPRRVEELLEKGKIRVQAQPGGTGTNWEFVDYDTYINLNEEQRSLIRINGTNRNKTLFSSDWSDEDIALLIREAELNIKDILAEKGLPLTGTPGRYWRDHNLNSENITAFFRINGKSIEIRLGGKYDSNGNIDYTIETLFPN